MRFILSLLLSLLTCVASAQTKPGMDYLGGVQFERAMLKAHPEGWTAGIFLRTFGDAKRTIEKMAASGKFSEIVVHTEPFDPTHKYDIAKAKRRLREDFRWLQALAVKFPSVVIMGSPFCEHNHPASKMEPLFKELQAIAPNVVMVNTIWKGGVVPGIITEIHLENSKPRAKPQGNYIVTTDGFGGDGSGDITDANVEEIVKRYSDARQFRIWNFRFNGKFGHKDKAPVNQRINWPGESYIRAHAWTLKPREGGLTWPKTHLLKPLADDHGEGGKDNKLMAILPGVNRSSIKVHDSKGNHIDTMKRFLPDHSGNPKGPRYYSTKWAYQVADIAKRNTGSSLIKVHNMPLTDGYLRSGLFR